LILDTSAVIAVVFGEPDRQAILEHVRRAELVGIGAPTLAEAGVVATASLGVAGRAGIRAFVEDAGIVVVPFVAAHWHAAVDAFSRYGKGHHPARLNFGDCLTYATARLAGQPLLCLGENFAKTDLVVVAL
jgi:ribonuclease VapC